MKKLNKNFKVKKLTVETMGTCGFICFATCLYKILAIISLFIACRMVTAANPST